MANHTTFNLSRVGKVMDGEVRRHIERLLLRLDFNGGFTNLKWKKTGDILPQG
ncbi:hypothetical protein MPER_14385, partial [Moniliophthora perniciosa FA553]